MVMLDLKDLEVDNVILGYNWDQDEKQLYMHLTVNDKVNVQPDLVINVTETDISITYKEELVWGCQFFNKVVKNTCRVSSKDNLLIIQVDKQTMKEEWPYLLKSDEKQDSDDDNTTDHLFELQFVKTDFYERDGTVSVSVFVKKIVDETIHVNFEKEELDVKFSSKDPNFLKMYEGTTESTVFHWKIKLSNEIIPEKCTSKAMSTKLEIKLKKATSTKWSSLEKQIIKSSSTEAKPNDGWHSLGSKPTKSIRGAAGGAKSIAVVEQVQPKKPTCAVQPMSYSNNEDSSKQALYQIGFTGLDNMGNTCFMNSVLQVLANTRELREYVMSGSPQNELNQENPLGSSGKLMIAFAVLMKSLWGGTHRSIAPKKLKALVAAKASQFMGYAQHDAQEFMAFLLDILHEDVNRVKKKPYFENKEDTTNRPAQELADEAWKRHRARNDSVIVDLFHGQYKSKLVCPTCNKVSVTYDPFMELVVPLPKKKQIFSVIFMSRNFQNKPVRYIVSLSEDAMVYDLKQSVSEKTGINPTCLRVFRENGGCFQYKFKDIDALSKYKADNFFFVVEVLSEAAAGEKVLEISVIQRLLMPKPRSYCSFCKKQRVEGSKLKRCTKCYRAAYCGQACQKQHWTTHKSNCYQAAESVGVPFIISLPESKASYRRLEQMMEGFARYSVAVFQPPVQQTSSLGGKAPNDVEMEDEQSFPATTETDEPTTFTSQESNDVEMEEEEEEETSTKVPKLKTATVAGQVKTETRNSPLFFIKPVDIQGKSLPKIPRLEDKGHEPLNLQDYEYLAMDWRNNEKMDQYVLVESKSIEFDDDVHASNEDSVTTLVHCIDLFTRPEKLSKEEAWYCPKCKEHREATKEMSIWRLPSTLIIQLKRFSFKNALWRDKINKKIVYPTRGLNLTDYVYGLHSGPAIFDLYGVINHHGGLLGGHYVAFARLPGIEHCHSNDIGWRLFDDSIVRAVDEKYVVTQSAYLLFYRQRRPYQSLIQNPSVEAQTSRFTREKEPIGKNDLIQGSRDTEHATQRDPYVGKSMPDDDSSESIPENGKKQNMPEDGAKHSMPENGAKQSMPEHGSEHMPKNDMEYNKKDRIDKDCSCQKQERTDEEEKNTDMEVID
ncbi:ubiquitin carboxyl-terminal hydrolase 19-like [Antedon mediterranea]|uniref:ubiquitin carboxyl-terminal hydrolase 19-like n=1 Tax=Antedon mediterranea TaxID=105859 RepID=UPI003AF5A6AA